jgi:hypothetical protein
MSTPAELEAKVQKALQTTTITTSTEQVIPTFAA